ncbi:MAG: DUF5320 domain-containing protein [Christensenellales bacterium]|jgi:hypothetical protein
MPNRDGSGPAGNGAMTGRGQGICRDANLSGDDACFTGLGRTCGRGFGRGFNRGFAASSKTQKELLEEQKNMLKDRIETIDRRLKNL